MNPSALIHHDAVLRARVALLGSGKPPLVERVAAYRVLAQVSPLAYLPKLAAALGKYSRQFAHEPGTALALCTESVAAARRMCALEPERSELLVAALARRREQSALMGRSAEAGADGEEIALLASGGRRTA